MLRQLALLPLGEASQIVGHGLARDREAAQERGAAPVVEGRLAAGRKLQRAEALAGLGRTADAEGVLRSAATAAPNLGAEAACA